MYILECDKRFNKKLPIPDFYSRFSSISQSDKPNIIIIKEQFDDPTFRYRGYNIIQTMKNNCKYNLNCFLVRELSELYNVFINIFNSFYKNRNKINLFEKTISNIENEINEFNFPNIFNCHFMYS